VGPVEDVGDFVEYGNAGILDDFAGDGEIANLIVPLVDGRGDDCAVDVRFEGFGVEMVGSQGAWMQTSRVEGDASE
jgi:hypothetical protein